MEKAGDGMLMCERDGRGGGWGTQTSEGWHRSAASVSWGDYIKTGFLRLSTQTVFGFIRCGVGVEIWFLKSSLSVSYAQVDLRTTC